MELTKKRVKIHLVVYVIVVSVIAFGLLAYQINSLFVNLDSSNGYEEPIVGRTGNLIVINQYSKGKLHARFTIDLERDERYPINLFLPRRNTESGATQDVRIKINRLGKISQINIDGMIHRCDEKRIKRMCDEARILYNDWSTGMDVNTHVKTAMRSEEQFFDFTPYFPFDDCRP